MSSLNDAVSFIKNNKYCSLKRKRTLYSVSPNTQILENCVVLHKGKVVQINLKKGGKRNYEDQFNGNVIVVKLACNPANGYCSLERQRKAATHEDTIELNIAIWLKADGIKRPPDVEELFLAKIIQVLHSEIQVQIIKRNVQKRSREDSKLKLTVKKPIHDIRKFLG